MLQQRSCARRVLFEAFFSSLILPLFCVSFCRQHARACPPLCLVCASAPSFSLVLFFSPPPSRPRSTPRGRHVAVDVSVLFCALVHSSLLVLILFPWRYSLVKLLSLMLRRHGDGEEEGRLDGLFAPFLCACVRVRVCLCSSVVQIAHLVLELLLLVFFL